MTWPDSTTSKSIVSGRVHARVVGLHVGTAMPGSFSSISASARVDVEIGRELAPCSAAPSKIAEAVAAPAGGSTRMIRSTGRRRASDGAVSTPQIDGTRTRQQCECSGLDLLVGHEHRLAVAV